MKEIFKIFVLLFFINQVLYATTPKTYEQIEKMQKGLDGYIIGKALTNKQEKILERNLVKSEDSTVSKFLAKNDLLIAINKKNRKVIAINKKFNNLTSETIKGVIGTLIHDFNEPTAMAHDKMIYWIFNEDGKKVSEEDLNKYKDAIQGKITSAMPLAKAVNVKQKDINFNPYIAIKLSSDQPIMTKQKEKKPINAYLMISSDKLIKMTTGLK